ncbi:glycosyltransferase family 4 protein [Photobacterium damselae]|uniref:glycosyltransferase family 4 protein n=1 Tax=Photobacterium damselae TaxID=38293 RepID=UPI0018A47B0F|nr:glycosyltransferase family 4 protein [Photobacterium damselae]QOQ69297.1 glycosyltransferase family 4 protein [Photobacterium damselae subsp. damselae]
MIYIISPFENDFESRGTRNLSLYKRLIGNGESVKFITSNFSHQNKNKVSHDDFSKDINYKIIDVIPYNRNLSVKRFLTHIDFSIKLYLYLYKVIQNGDKIIVSSIPPEMIFVLTLLKGNKDIEITLDVRDIWPDALPLGGLKKKLFKLYCNFFYSRCDSHVDNITYVAESFKYKWINKYCPSHNGFFLPLGYDDLRWGRDSSKKNRNNLKFVYIGYLQSQFPLKEIIESVNDKDGFELHIIGDGENKRKYEEISSKNIIFHGNQPLDKAAELVSNSDVGILPISGNAQMPNKLFDYLGAALPILSIGDTDSSRFVIDNNIGWTSGFNVAELESIIADIKDNIEEKEFNVKSIRSKYSKEKLYDKFVNILKGKL